MDALMLADQTTTNTQKATNLHAFVEGAFGVDDERDVAATKFNERLSLDLQYEQAFLTNWRAVLADRLDVDWPAQPGEQHAINTIKEGYLSWHGLPDTILDVGRINEHLGTAIGYNPTDFFRLGAQRSIVSIDPLSLKNNRQGSVMLRGQRFWEGGSVMALYSPQLDTKADSNGFNPDWGATNHENRGLIALSEKFSDYFNPQLLLYKQAGLPAQLGLNLTELLNHATIAYVEWSGGRSPSLLSQSLRRAGLAVPDDTTFRSDLSAGITYTTPHKISLTAELEYNGGGLSDSRWKGLWTGQPALYGQYRAFVQSQQDIPTQRVVLLYATWQSALLHNLDLTAMDNFDMADSSQQFWFEARYHADRWDCALQWQLNSGERLSNYGATAQRQSAQFLLRYFF